MGHNSSGSVLRLEDDLRKRLNQKSFKNSQENPISYCTPKDYNRIRDKQKQEQGGLLKIYRLPVFVLIKSYFKISIPIFTRATRDGLGIWVLCRWRSTGREPCWEGSLYYLSPCKFLFTRRNFTSG